MAQHIVSSSVQDDDQRIDIDDTVNGSADSPHHEPSHASLDEDVSDDFARRNSESTVVARPSPLMDKIGPLPGWAWIMIAVAVLGLVATMLVVMPKPASPFTDVQENMAQVESVGVPERPVIGGGFEPENVNAAKVHPALAASGATESAPNTTSSGESVSNDLPTAQPWEVVALDVANIKAKMDDIAKRQSALEAGFAKQMSEIERELGALQKKAGKTATYSKPIPQKPDAPKAAKTRLSDWSVSAINEGDKALVVSPDGQKHMVSVGDEVQGVVVKTIAADHIKTSVGVIR